MEKSEFLKQAKEKYKAKIKNEWVSEMNFVFSDKLILRVWFESEGVLEGIIHHKWCSVETLPLQDEDENKIEEELSRFVANDSESYPAIINALKKELVANPERFVDYVVIDTKNETTIDPLDKLEFTLMVKDLCSLIGIGRD